jgi:hypothetical protein
MKEYLIKESESHSCQGKHSTYVRYLFSGVSVRRWAIDCSVCTNFYWVPCLYLERLYRERLYPERLYLENPLSDYISKDYISKDYI